MEYYSPDELGGIGGAAIDFGTNNATTATNFGTSTNNATTTAIDIDFGTSTNNATTAANQLPNVFDDVTTGELLDCVADLFGEHQATILLLDNYATRILKCPQNKNKNI
jgi:hypothetical protein